jgi:hypothetical protein
MYPQHGQQRVVIKSPQHDPSIARFSLTVDLRQHKQKGYNKQLQTLDSIPFK